MNQFQIALMIGAIIALLLSTNLPRSWLWILAGAGSFAASTLYARFGLPYPSAFSVTCDSAVVLAIYHCAKEKYELVLWRVFQAMILINILYLAGWIGPHWAYIIALELMNWAALLFITGTAIAERIAHSETHPGWLGNRRLRGFSMALRSQRAEAPWHKVSK